MNTLLIELNIDWSASAANVATRVCVGKVSARCSPIADHEVSSTTVSQHISPPFAVEVCQYTCSANCWADCSEEKISPVPIRRVAIKATADAVIAMACAGGGVYTVAKSSKKMSMKHIVLFANFFIAFPPLIVLQGLRFLVLQPLLFAFSPCLSSS